MNIKNFANRLMAAQLALSICLSSGLYIKALAANTTTSSKQSSPAPISMNLSSPQRSTAPAKYVGISITVNGKAQTVGKGQLKAVTPAELLAAYQVQSSGKQSIVLSGLGEAIGGSLNIAPKLSQLISSLIIPAGVTAVDNAAVNPNLSLSGNLVNNGTFIAISSNSQVSTASISALNITNMQGGIISSALPASGVTGLLSAVHLNLSAVQNITNYGTIESSGNLNVVAGGSIINSSSAGAASGTVAGSASGNAPVMQAMNNVTLNAATISNQGQIAAVQGSLSATSSSLNNSGSMQALTKISLQASASIQNSGTIASSGSLSANSPSIQNGLAGSGSSSTATSPAASQALILCQNDMTLTSASISNSGGVIASQGGNLTLDTPSLTNSGCVQAQSGNVTVQNSSGNALSINNTNGSITAGNNLIIQTQAGMQSTGNAVSNGNVSITGGTLAANAVSLLNPGGTLAVNVDSINGAISASAGPTTIFAGSNDLTIANLQLTGGVTVAAASGNIFFNNGASVSTSGNDAAFIAASSIATLSPSASSNTNVSAQSLNNPSGGAAGGTANGTASGGTASSTAPTPVNFDLSGASSGGNMTLLAGYSSALVGANKDGSINSSTSVRVTGPSSSGGDVYLSAYHINTAVTGATGGNGGNVTIAASGGSNTGGEVYLGSDTTGSINTSTVGIGNGIYGPSMQPSSSTSIVAYTTNQLAPDTYVGAGPNAPVVIAEQPGAVVNIMFVPSVSGIPLTVPSGNTVQLTAGTTTPLQLTQMSYLNTVYTSSSGLPSQQFAPGSTLSLQLPSGAPTAVLLTSLTPIVVQNAPGSTISNGNPGQTVVAPLTPFLITTGNIPAAPAPSGGNVTIIGSAVNGQFATGTGGTNVIQGAINTGSTYGSAGSVTIAGSAPSLNGTLSFKNGTMTGGSVSPTTDANGNIIATGNSGGNVQFSGSINVQGASSVGSIQIAGNNVTTAPYNDPTGWTMAQGVFQGPAAPTPAFSLPVSTGSASKTSVQPGPEIDSTGSILINATGTAMLGAGRYAAGSQNGSDGAALFGTSGSIAVTAAQIQFDPMGGVFSSNLGDITFQSSGMILQPNVINMNSNPAPCGGNCQGIVVSATGGNIIMSAAGAISLLLPGTQFYAQLTQSSSPSTTNANGVCSSSSQPNQTLTYHGGAILISSGSSNTYDLNQLVSDQPLSLLGLAPGQGGTVDTSSLGQNVTFAPNAYPYSWGVLQNNGSQNVVLSGGSIQLNRGVIIFDTGAGSGASSGSQAAGSIVMPGATFETDSQTNPPQPGTNLSCNCGLGYSSYYLSSSNWSFGNLPNSGNPPQTNPKPQTPVQLDQPYVNSQYWNSDDCCAPRSPLYGLSLQAQAFYIWATGIVGSNASPSQGLTVPGGPPTLKPNYFQTYFWTNTFYPYSYLAAMANTAPDDSSTSSNMPSFVPISIARPGTPFAGLGFNLNNGYSALSVGSSPDSANLNNGYSALSDGISANGANLNNGYSALRAGSSPDGVNLNNGYSALSSGISIDGINLNNGFSALSAGVSTDSINLNNGFSGLSAGISATSVNFDNGFIALSAGSFSAVSVMAGTGNGFVPSTTKGSASGASGNGDGDDDDDDFSGNDILSNSNNGSDSSVDLESVINGINSDVQSQLAYAIAGNAAYQQDMNDQQQETNQNAADFIKNQIEAANNGLALENGVYVPIVNASQAIEAGQMTVAAPTGIVSPLTYVGTIGNGIYNSISDSISSTYNTVDQFTGGVLSLGVNSVSSGLDSLSQSLNSQNTQGQPTTSLYATIAQGADDAYSFVTGAPTVNEIAAQRYPNDPAMANAYAQSIYKQAGQVGVAVTVGILTLGTGLAGAGLAEGGIAASSTEQIALNIAINTSTGAAVPTVFSAYDNVGAYASGEINGASAFNNVVGTAGSSLGSGAISGVIGAGLSPLSQIFTPVGLTPNSYASQAFGFVAGLPGAAVGSTLTAGTISAITGQKYEGSFSSTFMPSGSPFNPAIDGVIGYHISNAGVAGSNLVSNSFSASSSAPVNSSVSTQSSTLASVSPTQSTASSSTPNVLNAAYNTATGRFAVQGGNLTLVPSPSSTMPAAQVLQGPGPNLVIAPAAGTEVGTGAGALLNTSANQSVSTAGI